MLYIYIYISLIVFFEHAYKPGNGPILDQDKADELQGNISDRKGTFNADFLPHQMMTAARLEFAEAARVICAVGQPLQMEECRNLQAKKEDIQRQLDASEAKQEELKNLIDKLQEGTTKDEEEVDKRVQRYQQCVQKRSELDKASLTFYRISLCRKR